MKTCITKDEYIVMYNIVGAAMEVYNVLGRGMEEPIYQEALDMELIDRGMNPHREVWLDTFYKGKKLTKQYKADFVIDGIIVELKSVSTFDSEHRAQLFKVVPNFI
jgi:GxxExxY protein